MVSRTLFLLRFLFKCVIFFWSIGHSQKASQRTFFLVHHYVATLQEYFCLSIHYIVWFVGQLSSSPHLLAEWLYNACGMSLWNRHGDGGGGLTGERESLRQSWEEDESIGGKTKKDRGDPRRKEEGVDAAMGGMTGTEDECILVYPLDTWPTCHGFIFAHYQATKMIPLSEES